MAKEIEEESWLGWFFGQIKEKKIEAAFVALIFILLVLSFVLQAKLPTH